MIAYFPHGRPIGRADEVQKVGEEIGLPADEVAAMLAGDAFTDEVRRDEALAHQIGVTGIPFFVFDGTYAVAGAQPVEVLEQALNRAWDEAHASA